MRRNRKTKRIDRIRDNSNRLVYKRTEIDAPAGFDTTKLYYPLVILSVAGILYLMFFSNVFNVAAVEVRGTRELRSEEVEKDVSGRLQSQIIKNNLFLFDKDGVSRDLKKKYALKEIKIKKQYPKKIEVSLSEYILVHQWFSDGKYYLIDEKGKAVVERTEKKENLPVVEDKKSLPVEVGKSLVTVEFNNFIKYLDKNFTDSKGGKITKLEVNESFNEIYVYSDLGFYVIFDTTRDPAVELKNLLAALSSKDITGKKLTYLDMRIKNKVYYK